MSSDEQDVDIESDEDENEVDSGSSSCHGTGLDGDGVDKRAHHNALERKRRDHIKDSFNGLKDSIPSMQVKMHGFLNLYFYLWHRFGFYCFIFHSLSPISFPTFLFLVVHTRWSSG
jgi:hypothetical protein